MPLILEGIVTTRNEDASLNVAPMGPIVDRDMTQLTLRPFQSSRTYANLRRTGVGVFHVTDDVELLARAAIGQLDPAPLVLDGPAGRLGILAAACRWYAIRVREFDERSERTIILCEVTDRGVLRDFFGFNRAKHAVVEAAILATRLDILPPHQILEEFSRLAVIIEKTAGDQEWRAFELLRNHVMGSLRGP